MIYIEMPLWLYILTIVLLFLVLITLFASIIMGMVIEQKQKKAIEKTYGDGECPKWKIAEDLIEHRQKKEYIQEKLDI